MGRRNPPEKSIAGGMRLVKSMALSTTGKCDRAAAAGPTIVISIGNHDNNQHGDNENLRLQNLWDGIEWMAALLAT